jgi:hypothetical protein
MAGSKLERKSLFDKQLWQCAFLRSHDYKGQSWMAGWSPSAATAPSLTTTSAFPHQWEPQPREPRSLDGGLEFILSIHATFYGKQGRPWVFRNLENARLGQSIWMEGVSPDVQSHARLAPKYPFRMVSIQAIRALQYV